MDTVMPTVIAVPAPDGAVLRGGFFVPVADLLIAFERERTAALHYLAAYHLDGAHRALAVASSSALADLPKQRASGRALIFANFTSALGFAALKADPPFPTGQVSPRAPLRPTIELQRDFERAGCSDEACDGSERERGLLWLAGESAFAYHLCIDPISLVPPRPVVLSR